VTHHDIIVRPIITEKGIAGKDEYGTFCLEVNRDANKTQIRQAVEKLFSVKVAEVRTSTTAGKLRRRGKFQGYRADWKKAFVRLEPGQKVPEFAEI
jgi:large subunit ribosomal protein L23